MSGEILAGPPQEKLVALGGGAAREATGMGARILLQVRDLATEFMTRSGPARAVDGVSFDVHAGEIIGLVGESGSGKSVTG